MLRTDLSYFLIHWTSGSCQEEAFDNLYNIIQTQQILGNSNLIKGSYKCVCFTETPAHIFQFDKSKYKPFGISVSKRFLYSLGARPVIYESDEEFELLPEEIRWRHMHYDPCMDSPIDFTWEREWRLKADQLFLEYDEFDVIVPDEMWEDELLQRFEKDEILRYECEKMGYGEDLAYHPQPFLFKIKRIRNN